MFTYIKLSRRLIWLLACGENKTQVVDLSSFAGGFLMTDFVTLVGGFELTRVCWHMISFWLCVYIYKAQPKVDLLLACVENKTQVVDLSLFVTFCNM